MSDTASAPLVMSILLLLGLCFLLGGLAMLVHIRRRISTFIPTQGIIARLEQRSSGRRTYAPVVQFQSADGQPREFISNVSSNPPVGQAGDPIGVLYNPDDPNDARVSRFADLWFAPMVLIFMGSVFTLIGGIGIYGIFFA